MSDSNAVYIASVVATYWVVSISMVYLNKVLMSNEGISIPAPLFVTWYQCVVTVLICWLAGLCGQRARGTARYMPVSAGEGEPADAPKSFFAQFPKAEYLVGQAKAIFPLSLVFGEFYGLCVNTQGACTLSLIPFYACVYCCSGDDHLQQSVPQACRGVILQRGQEFNHRLQRLLLPVSATYSFLGCAIHGTVNLMHMPLTQS